MLDKQGLEACRTTARHLSCTSLNYLKFTSVLWREMSGQQQIMACRKCICNLKLFPRGCMITLDNIPFSQSLEGNCY